MRLIGIVTVPLVVGLLVTALPALAGEVELRVTENENVRAVSPRLPARIFIAPAQVPSATLPALGSEGGLR